MVEAGSMPALEVLARASRVISEGEVLQLTRAHDLNLPQETYLEIIRAKTAELFAAAAEAGAISAGASEAQCRALRRYGQELGLAFQLVDDALDYSGDSAHLGKSIGDDFREGKITLPVILAFRRGSDDDRAFWNRTIVSGEIAEGDLEHAIGLMKRHNTLDATIERARSYGSIARDALAIFRQTREKQALADVIDFCIARAY